MDALINHCIKKFIIHLSHPFIYKVKSLIGDYKILPKFANEFFKKIRVRNLTLIFI
nr:MAG TPA: hypothetical protein [Caudoviricetes sp.]